ncbi:unnamed protein product [Vitrella brassicaformis CCMP3155]|uniref:Uncharacterized protein n=2 Tax=Vitrella brassicaformis TaxID=1169539 RepID=A0A0G4GZS6_VITBC|nr:unnamed protein product [Vitrella brassicaformis CCMP3155]|eukprot:CEM36757.1 unnamed protein product [Vitrella brassicaformis CCMP3155]
MPRLFFQRCVALLLSLLLTAAAFTDTFTDEAPQVDLEPSGVNDGAADDNGWASDEHVLWLDEFDALLASNSSLTLDAADDAIDEGAQEDPAVAELTFFPNITDDILIRIIMGSADPDFADLHQRLIAATEAPVRHVASEAYGYLALLYLFGVPDERGNVDFPHGWPRDVDKAVECIIKGSRLSCGTCYMLAGFLFSIGYPPLVRSSHGWTVDHGSGYQSIYMMFQAVEVAPPYRSPHTRELPKERQGYDLPTMAYSLAQHAGAVMGRLSLSYYFRHELAQQGYKYRHLARSASTSMHRPPINLTATIPPHLLQMDGDSLAILNATTAAEIGAAAHAALHCQVALEALLGVASDSLNEGSDLPAAELITNRLEWKQSQSRWREDYGSEQPRYGSLEYAQLVEDLALREDPDGLAALGELYYHGLREGGIPRDIPQAMAYWHRASVLGHCGAAMARALAHIDGAYGSTNDSSPYLAQVATKSDDQSQRHMAKHYLSKFGIGGSERNLTRAGLHLEAAAALGDSSAQLLIGHAYAGADTDVLPADGLNTTRALLWYDKASAAGRIVAKYNAGVLILQGADVRHRTELQRCEAAFPLFFEVAMNHETVKLLFAHARRAYTLGDVSGALLRAMLLSEIGHPLAHESAAELWRQWAQKPPLHMQIRQQDLTVPHEVEANSTAAANVTSDPAGVRHYLHCWARPDGYYTRLRWEGIAAHDAEGADDQSAAQQVSPQDQQPEGDADGDYIADGRQLTAVSPETATSESLRHLPPDAAVCSFYFAKRAAVAGSVAAMHRVARAYREGSLGVIQNLTTSYEWTCLAAAMGDSRGRYEKAVMTEKGIGRPSNTTEAYQMYGSLLKEGSVAPVAGALVALAEASIGWLSRRVALSWRALHTYHTRLIDSRLPDGRDSEQQQPSKAVWVPLQQEGPLAVQTYQQHPAEPTSSEKGKAADVAVSDGQASRQEGADTDTVGPIPLYVALGYEDSPERFTQLNSTLRLMMLWAVSFAIVLLFSCRVHVAEAQRRAHPRVAHRPEASYAPQPPSISSSAHSGSASPTSTHDGPSPTNAPTLIDNDPAVPEHLHSLTERRRWTAHGQGNGSGEDAMSSAACESPASRQNDPEIRERGERGAGDTPTDAGAGGAGLLEGKKMS